MFAAYDWKPFLKSSNFKKVILRDLPYGDIILHTFIGKRLKAERVKDRENNTSLDNVKELSSSLLLAGADR
jgi:hypothetical protein